MSLPYQPYYCEENIWRLCRHNPFDGDDVYAVVMSNRAGACPLWNQQAAPTPERPVFWDYHVVAIERRPETAVVWDLDTRLDCPTPLETWWRGTFPLLERLSDEFQPTFRVVDRRDYLDHLSSDRSHMQREGGEFKKPPPDWETIYEADVGMNLGRFVDMEDDFLGALHSAKSFLSSFTEAAVTER